MEQLDSNTALALALISLACVIIWFLAHMDDDGDE